MNRAKKKKKKKRIKISEIDKVYVLMDSIYVGNR